MKKTREVCNCARTLLSAWETSDALAALYRNQGELKKRELCDAWRAATDIRLVCKMSLPEREFDVLDNVCLTSQAPSETEFAKARIAATQNLGEIARRELMNMVIDSGLCEGI